jgi:hypothetical protein
LTTPSVLTTTLEWSHSTATASPSRPPWVAHIARYVSTAQHILSRHSHHRRHACHTPCARHHLPSSKSTTITNPPTIQEQRNRVKALLEANHDEESIEKETGVSDRTVRRWKLELERTGRIGKVGSLLQHAAAAAALLSEQVNDGVDEVNQPPEARTGRHRVLSAEIEAVSCVCLVVGMLGGVMLMFWWQALFEHVKDKPDMSVDDMLWWLYDQYKIVVGTRTIRRVFERKGDKVRAKSGRRGSRKSNAREEDDDEDDEDDQEQSTPMQPNTGQYQSPYAPIVQQASAAEQQLAQALQVQQQQQQQTPQQTYPPPPMDLDGDLPDDEETIQLQLQQIALQKREVELKLKMRQLQSGKGTPSSGRKAPPTRTSTLYNPAAVVPTGPKRDSRSKKKIEESKKRTAERQERMLRDLERRSRRRDHLTAEWVNSKDIWPLRAQGMLADLMHQYSCYAFSQSTADTFEVMYRELYQLVDLNKGDWVPAIHDDMLRERMKRKMGQLRTKMQKSGEILPRTDGYSGFTKAENYTGEQAGAALGDESEIVSEMQSHVDMQAQAGAAQMQDDQMHYEPVPDHQQMSDHQQLQDHNQLQDHSQMQDHSQLQASNMGYMMGNQGPGQYPMMDHTGMMPYGSMSGQSGGMVM